MHHLLRQKTATVYTEDPTTGLFTVVATTDLDCALLHASRTGAVTAQDRATLAAERIFVWPAAEYTLPTYCELEVEGDRWVPVEVNAYERFKGPDGTTHHGRVPVRKRTIEAP